MNENMNKALVYFGREDLTDGLYENDIDDNVQIFLTIRQMIKLYNLQSKIDKAVEYYETHQQECVIGRNKDDKLIKDYYLPAQCSKKLYEFLKEDK